MIVIHVNAFVNSPQFIVGEDGTCGLVYEHAPAEGPPIVFLIDSVVKYMWVSSLCFDDYCLCSWMNTRPLSHTFHQQAENWNGSLSHGSPGYASEAAF